MVHMQENETGPRPQTRKRSFSDLSANTKGGFLTRAGDYVFNHKLPSGTSSDVYLAVNPKTGKQVVAKVTRRQVAVLAEAENHSGLKMKEGKIHSQLHHRHILPMVDVVDGGNRVCLVTEYASGGDLRAHVLRTKGLPVKEAWRLFSQLVEAVGYLHQMGIAHRDIKPENIFLDENGDVLLGDFGLACKFTSGKSKVKACGTMGFLAPCLLQNDVSYVGPDVDCWSLGVCLFFMLTARCPFHASSELKMSQKIRTGRYKWRKGEPGGSVRDLVAKLLVVLPSQRATVDDVLTHSWMTEEPIVPRRSHSFGSGIQTPPKLRTNTKNPNARRRRSFDLSPLEFISE